MHQVREFALCCWWWMDYSWTLLSRLFYILTTDIGQEQGWRCCGRGSSCVDDADALTVMFGLSARVASKSLSCVAQFGLLSLYRCLYMKICWCNGVRFILTTVLQYIV